MWVTMPDESDLPGEVTGGELATEAFAGLISAVPAAGGPLAAIATGILRRRQNRRLGQFLRDLNEDLIEVRETIDEGFTETEDFKDLAEEILSRAADTRQREKLKAYRAIFVNTVTADQPRFDQAAEIATLVSRWQPTHIEFLRDFSEVSRKRTPFPRRRAKAPSEGAAREGVLEHMAEILGWPLPQVRRIWQELYASGVVRERITRSRQWDTEEIRVLTMVSEFGEEVIDFLAHPSERNS